MQDITQPLRLAVGSHARGSGKGCAMNLISWETGDTTITDLPDCADLMLARITQRVNDSYCTHRGDSDLLCPPCSQVVLELAHRTVGTGLLPLTEHERKVVHVTIAIDMAKQVQHLVPEHRKARAQRAIEAAEAWVANPCEKTRQNAAANAAAAYADANAASAAAYAASAASAADAAASAADAAASAAAAAYAADAQGVELGESRLRSARRAFDLFERLTSHRRVEVTAEQVEQAYACMVSTD